MIPSAGQGILAVQGRKGEDYGYLDGYCDRDAWLAGTAERAYVKYLDGGCSSPVAAFAEVGGDEIFIRGLYYSEATGKWAYRSDQRCSRGWREAWNSSCKAIEI